MSDIPFIWPDRTRDTWRYYLGDSSRGPEILILTELHLARSKTLDMTLNGNGKAGFTYPLRTPKSSMIQEITTCCVAVLNDTIKWSGPIMDVQEDLNNQMMTISSVGWLEELDFAFVQPEQAPDLIFDNEDSGEMAFALLDAANNRKDLTGSLVTWPTKITRGSADPCPLRTRTYPEQANIGQEILELSTVENGFDYYVDPATRQLEIRYPRLGAVRSELHFGYDLGPKNLKNVDIQSQGSTVRTREAVHGKYSTAIDEALTQMDLYGMREEHISLSDVADSTILGAYAIGETRVKREPKKTYSLTMKPKGLDREGNDITPPVYGVDFELGDTGFLSAKGGRETIIKQPTRIFGVSLSIDDEGNGTVNSLQTGLS